MLVKQTSECPSVWKGLQGSLGWKGLYKEIFPIQAACLEMCVGLAVEECVQEERFLCSI